MTRPRESWRTRNRERALELLAVLALVDAGAVWTPERVASCDAEIPPWRAALLMHLLCRYGYLRRDGSEDGAYRVTEAGRRAAVERMEVKR